MEFSAFEFGLIFLLVALNGFFVATEFALVSIRKSKVEELVSRGQRGAKSVRNAVEDLDRYIAGTQVGITLASLALGWIGEPAVAHALQHFFQRMGVDSPVFSHTVALGLAFLVITVLHVILGELVPKSLALQKSEAVALWVSRPMSFVVTALHPLIWVLNGLGNRVLRLIGIDAAGTHGSVHSVDELQILVQQSHEAGMLDNTEREVLQRSFRFAELTAKDIMVRRIDVISLDLSEPRDDLIAKAAASNHSRLPVCVGSLDHLVGVLFIHDLFRAHHRGTVPADLRLLCRRLLAVPETVHLDHLLDFFREQRTQIAAVVDEHGGTAGIVTFEDLVEEVTGEIQDEFEADEQFPQNLPDGRVILRGDTRLDDVNSILGWQLADEAVDTLAGFIMNELGRIARVDDIVMTPFGSLQVTDMARMRIVRIAAVQRPPSTEADASADGSTDLPRPDRGPNIS